MIAAMRTAILVASCLAPAVAAAAPPARHHFHVQAVDADAPGAPAEITAKARAMLGEILAARADFVVTLEGAPDPEREPEALKRFLEARRIRAYAVTVKITGYERSLAADDRPGRSGQILKVRVSLALVGTKMPGDVLAFAGKGSGTVAAEVGARPRPREEEEVMDDALKSAISEAVDGAVAELGRTPPKPASKKKTRRK
jgi:hypothetical protein